MMERVARRWAFGFVLATALFVAPGCGGIGQTVHLNVQQKQMAAPSPYLDPEPVQIVIEPFEDQRVDKNSLGFRTHLWGGVTYFDLAGDRPGEAIAQALADRLRTRGWKNRSWRVRLASGIGTTNSKDADIIISGQLLAASVTAKSRFFSTMMTTTTKIVITARNISDQSTTIRNIEEAQSDTAIWFGEEDLEQLLVMTLQDGFDRYLADTTIAHKTLRSAR